MQSRSHQKWRLIRTRWLPVSLLVVVAITTMASNALAINGNVAPYAIEIDSPSANLYPTAANSRDWVKDSLPNTDARSLVDSVATGVITGTTGAVATGHWYGARIVDGAGAGEQDIFLNGGKEDDLSSWTFGPGSVGSAKYDISQAYLANNYTDLFFGMERMGNNGSTAFDFEFNQAAPASAYVPRRTTGDVLFTFEVQGSGGSGSAVPHFFVWNGISYVEQLPPPASLVSKINQA